MMRLIFRRRERGFTLIELLIIIAVIAILSVVVVMVINPAELLRKGRDARRLAELNSLNKALLLYNTDVGSSGMGGASTVYVSIPDASPICANLGLPTLPSGWSYACVTQANLRKTDGTGWVPVNFGLISTRSPLGALPIDPINTVASGNYYTYATGGSWELTAKFESSKYASYARTDGGADPTLFEAGNNLAISPFAGGLVGYWRFDEDTGTTAADASGYGNNGTLTNGPAWTGGKVGGAVSFDGVDDYVNATNNPSLEMRTNSFSISAWIKTTVYRAGIVEKAQSNTDFYQFVIWNDKLYWAYRENSGVIREVSGIATVNNNIWHHVVAVRDSGNQQVRLYVDGSLDNNGTGGTEDVTIISNLKIGLDTSNSNYFNGVIDDVYIYNRALSAAEINAIYNATK